MDNRNFRGHGAHKRFMGWAKEKMTGDEAFKIFYGEKDTEGNEYPEEMKKEFIELFDKMKKMHDTLHADRKGYMEKWEKYMPEHRGFPDDGRFGEEGPAGYPGGGFHGHGEGFPRGGHGFYGR